MKIILTFLSLTIILSSCGQKQATEQAQLDFNKDLVVNAIAVLANDSLEGRGFGATGNVKARQFLINQFKTIGVEPAFASGYEQEFSHTLTGRRRQRVFPVVNPGEDYSNVPDTTLYGGNIIAKIDGKSEKTIVITGHLDHLGIRNGEIYNGADDDASGTAALLAIADYFKNSNPKHTLIIAAVDGEEIGSPGCKFLAQNFPGGIENVVLNINMDMIAHNDNNELWASGTYYTPQLKEPLAKIATPLTLKFGHDNPNDKSIDDWTRSSDHRIFHDLEIPFIYFGVEDHADYHRPSDTFENINQAFYLDAVGLIINAVDQYDKSLD